MEFNGTPDVRGLKAAVAYKNTLHLSKQLNKL